MGILQKLLLHGLQRSLPEAHAGAKGDQVETIISVEMIDHIMGGSFGLFKLLALHRAGNIDHHDNIARHHRIGIHFDTGRGQQNKIAILSRRFIAEDIETNRTLVRTKVEREVLLRADISGAVGDLAALVAGAFHHNVLVGAVDGAQTSLVL